MNKMDHTKIFNLLTIVSPNYPIGSFSYSHGLEWTIHEKEITDKNSFIKWLQAILFNGSLWTDSVIFFHAYQSLKSQNYTKFKKISNLSLTLQTSKERRLETVMQGNAFIKITKDVGNFDLKKYKLSSNVSYPIAFSIACNLYNLKIEESLVGLLHSNVSNLVSAGIRLIPLGQTDGQKLLNELSECIISIIPKVKKAKINQLGNCCWRSDISSMKHESQYTRIFRS